MPSLANDTLFEFLAGWVSGALGILVAHPLDTIRVRAQHQSGLGLGVDYGRDVRFVMRSYGATGFYRGVIPPVVLRGLQWGSMVGTMQLVTPMLDRFEYLSKKHHPVQRAAVQGAIGGCLAAGTIGNPVHLIKSVGSARPTSTPRTSRATRASAAVYCSRRALAASRSE